MEFRTTLDEHLAAIAARDIDRFAATLSRDPQARVVGPDGSAIVGHDAIVAAHRAWFASETDWSFQPHIVLLRTGKEFGFVLLEVDYRDETAQRRFLLSLLFTREDDAWKLFYDQNTPLP